MEYTKTTQSRVFAGIGIAWTLIALLLTIGSLSDKMYLAAILLIISGLTALPWVAKRIQAAGLQRGWRVALPYIFGLAGAFAVGIAAPEPSAAPKVAATPKPDIVKPVTLPRPQPVAVATAPAENAQAKSLADQREQVLDYVRTVSMQVVFCTGEVDYTQSAIDKVSAGTAPAMQAYSAAHVGERDCKKASTELAQLNKAPFANQSWNAMLSRTLPSCRSTTREGGGAMTIAKVVLDGNSSLAKAQQYKDARNVMIGKAIECKMGLRGLAEEAGLPKEQINFLQ
jgi:hypothetical protein